MRGEREKERERERGREREIAREWVSELERGWFEREGMIEGWSERVSYGDMGERETYR